jgi:outer membrane murein-binding lipoprotein Lpp
MDRRHFALALPATLLAGCHSESKPSREATLLHNRAVREAVADLEQAVNLLDMRLTAFGPENWRDALANLKTSVVRLHSEMDELKHALGYAEPNEPESPGEHS